MGERQSGAHEPNDQGSHCSTLSLRSTRSARSSPCRIHQRLQLHPSAEDPKRPHPLRIYLQMLDFPARTIQTQSAPENAGTKHLVILGLMYKVRNSRTHLRVALPAPVKQPPNCPDAADP